jgi:hypothetical protein
MAFNQHIAPIGTTMSSSRNSNYQNLDNKVAAIRAGTREDSFNAAEMLMFACRNHKNGKSFEPIALSTLSALTPSGRATYLSEAIKDINLGKSTTLSKNCAAFIANMTGTDIDFWRRTHYTLAEAENIQITLPHEVKPEPTIAGPAIHAQGVKPPTARELAKAVLFPPDLTSTNIARHMKDNGGIKR